VHADLRQQEKKMKTNFEGVASDSILRMVVVKHIEGLSFRENIIRIDDSQMLRFFCRIFDDAIIDYSTFAKLANYIQPRTWEAVNGILARYCKQEKKIEGKDLRLDTTAVETDIHFPVDSSLLLDSNRVLTRLLIEVRGVDFQYTGGFRSRLDDAKRYAVAILRESHAGRQRQLYRKLLATTQRVVEHAQRTIIRIGETLKDESRATKLGISALQEKLAHYIPLALRCLDQARRRVMEGEAVPNSEKLFSIFEPHTELLIRGKAGKPVEFGHMVELHQVEGGLITGYAAHAQRPAEPGLLNGAVEKHNALFGRLPEVVAADKGFYAGQEVANLKKRGIKTVAIGKKGKRTEQEEQEEHGVLFKAAQRFRAGIEGAISTLKRSYRLRRCLSKGWERFENWVGAAIFARNLWWLASP
jgi:IS5 family transposase